MSELAGIGLDLCGIQRMTELLKDGRFLQKYFNEEERAYIMNKGATAAQTAAGIYAAKEALVKALGIGITVPLREIGIAHTALGQPFYRLTDKAAEAAAPGSAFRLSVTHEGDAAAAVCVWIKE